MSPLPAVRGLGAAGTRDGDRDVAVTPLGHSRDRAGAWICHLSLWVPLSQGQNSSSTAPERERRELPLPLSQHFQGWEPPGWERRTQKKQGITSSSWAQAEATGTWGRRESCQCEGSVKDHTGTAGGRGGLPNPSGRELGTRGTRDKGYLADIAAQGGHHPAGVPLHPLHQPVVPSAACGIQRRRALGRAGAA